MNRPRKRFYEFGTFRLDPAEHLLWQGEVRLPLTQKVCEVLTLLVENHGEVVSKEDFIQNIWPDTAVEEGILNVHIAALRKTLGDDRSHPQFIETIHRRGYRFLAAVTETCEKGEESSQKTLAVSISPAEKSIPLASMGGGRAAKRKFISHRVGFILILALAVFVTTIFALGWRPLVARKLLASGFERTKFVRLTTSGNNVAAVISPDGKYMAYVVNANGKQSLWVRVIANASDLQVLAPEDAIYSSLTFSPDSQTIYYDKTRDFRSGGGIYQLPVLGGVEKKLLSSTSGPPVSFSPGGKSFAFVRWNADAGTDDVWTTNADGTEARKLASHKIEGAGDTCTPSWSPDGKLIVCPWGTHNSMNLFAVEVEDGTVSPLLTETWDEIGEAIWLADGSGLVMTAKERGSDSFQIWLVSYPRGDARRITNDVNNYRSLSLTSDSSTIAAMQLDRQSNIWVTAAGDTRNARQVTFKNYDADNDQGLSLTPEGRIVYATKANGKSAIWITDQDGNQRPLTDNSSSNSMPAVTPDGRHIVFSSTRGGVIPHLWKMEIDGSNAKQLTNGPIEFLPQVSSDGKWVVYHSYTSGAATLWRTPIDGGEPVFLTNKVLDTYSSVSPDGQLISCLYLDEHEGKKTWKIAVVPFAGGPPVKLFDHIPSPISFAPLPWTRDGKALMYLDKKDGVSNIVQLTIATGETKQITNFTSDRIFYFGWSGDGKQLAVSRGKVNQDVVLIHDVR